MMYKHMFHNLHTLTRFSYYGVKFCKEQCWHLTETLKCNSAGHTNKRYFLLFFVKITHSTVRILNFEDPLYIAFNTDKIDNRDSVLWVVRNVELLGSVVVSTPVPRKSQESGEFA